MEAVESITSLGLHGHYLSQATYCKPPTGLPSLRTPLFCLWLGLPLCAASSPDLTSVLLTHVLALASATHPLGKLDKQHIQMDLLLIFSLALLSQGLGGFDSLYPETQLSQTHRICTYSLN